LDFLIWLKKSASHNYSFSRNKKNRQFLAFLLPTSLLSTPIFAGQFSLLYFRYSIFVAQFSLPNFRVQFSIANSAQKKKKKKKKKNGKFGSENWRVAGQFSLANFRWPIFAGQFSLPNSIFVVQY
jgi:hypothetical protein